MSVTSTNKKNFVSVLADTSAAPRLFQLMHAHGLGGMGSKDGRTGGIIGPHVLTLDRGIAQRALAVIEV